MITLKALGLWCVVLVLAIANGAFREAVLLQVLERPLAYTLSGLLLIACILAVSLFSIRWFGTLQPRRYLVIGLFWLVLTLVFEFAFGLLVRAEPLETVLAAYRFKDGNIWPLVLVAVAVAPVLAAFARGLVTLRSDR